MTEKQYVYGYTLIVGLIMALDGKADAMTTAVLAVAYAILHHAERKS